jgi:polyisoprenoid-binding protein YceI
MDGSQRPFSPSTLSISSMLLAKTALGCYSPSTGGAGVDVFLMMKTAFIAAVGAALLALATPAAADTWQLVKGYGEVRFSWDNMGLSRQSARFTEVEAELDFSPTEPQAASVTARIRVASVQSATRQFDDLLRRPEFFDAARHAYITFRSTRVEATGERSGVVAGDLTLMGVTKPVVLAVTWNFTGAHPLANVNPSYQGQWVSGFSATTTVQRSAFGLSRGLPLVSDAIEITIEAEFVRKAE